MGDAAIKSLEAVTLHSFNSTMGLCRTNFAQIFLFPKSSWRICQTVSSLTRSWFSINTRTVQWSLATGSQMFAIVSILWAVHGHPLPGSTFKVLVSFSETMKPFKYFCMRSSNIYICPCKHIICFCTNVFPTFKLYVCLLLHSNKENIKET
jgi:hypothetical protein